jgi:hypothetical protein
MIEPVDNQPPDGLFEFRKINHHAVFRARGVGFRVPLHRYI